MPLLIRRDVGGLWFELFAVGRVVLLRGLSELSYRQPGRGRSRARPSSASSRSAFLSAHEGSEGLDAARSETPSRPLSLPFSVGPARPVRPLVVGPPHV